MGVRGSRGLGDLTDRSTYLADWAASGVVALTGRHDGPPLVPPGCAATTARSAGLAFAELAAGVGRTVDVDARLLLGERAALLGLRRRGPWSAGRSCRAVRAADGWCAISLARPTDFLSVPALVEGASATTVPAQAWRAVQRWARGVSADEVAGRAQLLGIAAGPIEPYVAGSQATWRPDSVRLRASPRTPPPLVVDLSVLWAGPLAAHLLGLAGARIVKVEATDRLDGARRGSAAFYRLLHGGHESVVLDLRSATGRGQLRGLLERADIVIESSRPRALAQVGIERDEVCRQSPTTWVQLTAYGGEEARSNWVGFGDDVAMAAGLVAWASTRDGEAVPMPCGDAIADPLAGLHAAVAALASFLNGETGVIDVSMHDVVAATLMAGEISSFPARRAGHRWLVDTGEGLVPVAAPAARRPVGRVAAPGADTQRILAELAR